MKITEPTTMLTDYALAAMSVLFAVLLLRSEHLHRLASVRLWAGAFITTALAAILAGTYHGFSAHLGDAAGEILWKATVYSMGFVSFFMLAGSIVSSVGIPLRRRLLAAVILKFLFYAVWMAGHDDFRFVIYDYISAMVGVLIVQASAASMRREESAKWIIAGVLVSLIAAGAQQSGFTIHENVNHNDVYHIIQMVAVYLFFRGTRLLTVR